MHFHPHLSFLVNTEAYRVQVNGQSQAHVNIVHATFTLSDRGLNI